ncbi:WD40 repeat protein [Rhizobium sp. PP-CC-2G-626]|nr:WD40 repeat protein [Rhizobium sp. PP-CC-2G-626]
MSRIFISHSSQNNDETAALRDWLHEEGWSEIFLDFDGEKGLRPGSRWQPELTVAVQRCQTVLVLISPEWVASEWCKIEYFLAVSYQKPVIACIIKPTLMDTLPASVTIQHIVDISKHTENSAYERPQSWQSYFDKDELKKLKVALDFVGVEATHFDWPPQLDPERSPYPGLSSFIEEDAGIYFGRDGAISTALEKIRNARIQRTSRIIPILGASGAGKSSFLRAGLISRLVRDNTNFITLPVVRPGKLPVSGEAGIVESIYKASRQRGLSVGKSGVRAAVTAGGMPLRTLLSGLVGNQSSDDQRPAVILPVDQAEELLSLDSQEAAQFFDLLKTISQDDAENRDADVIVLMTIRTDSFDRMQLVPQLNGIDVDPISLGTMPIGEYGNVIRGPARRQTQSGKRLEIEEALVSLLLKDMQAGGAKDWLPLLSFTLERLHQENGDSGALTIAQYREMGGIRGSISAAIDRVLTLSDGRNGVPHDRPGKLLLLRRGLIPWLASIDVDTNSPRRRIARFSDIPEESRALISLMVDERLLSTDVDPVTQEKTIEPAHEALLREWSELDEWLQESLSDYSAIEGIRRGARDWGASGKNPAWLAHRGTRLEEAQRARAKPDFAKTLEKTDNLYIDLCQQAEDAEKNKRIRALRRSLIAACSVAVILAGLFGLSTTFYLQAKTSNSKALAALDITMSANAVRDGNLATAARLAAAAYERNPDNTSRSQLLSVGTQISPYLSSVLSLSEGPSAIAWRSDGVLLAAVPGGSIFELKAEATISSQSVAPRSLPKDGTKPMIVGLGGDAADVLAIYRDGQVASLTDGKFHDAGFLYPSVVIQGRGSLVSFAKSGKRMAALATDEIIVWGCGDLDLGQARCRAVRHPMPEASAVTMTMNGLWAVVATSSGKIMKIDTTTNQVVPLVSVNGRVRAIATSKSEDLLAVATNNGVIEIRKLTGGELIAESRKEEPSTGTLLTWSPVGDRLAYSCGFNQICIARVRSPDTHALEQEMVLAGHTTTPTRLSWSLDGNTIASASSDGELRTWRIAGSHGPAHVVKVGDEPLYAVSVDRRNGRVAVGDTSGRIYVGTADRLDPIADLPKRGNRISSVAFSDRGQIAALVEREGIIVAEDHSAHPSFFPVADNADLQQLAWVGNNIAVMAVRNEEIAIISTKNGATLKTLKQKEHQSAPWGAIGDKSGNRLYVSYTDGSIQQWNVTTERIEKTLFQGAGDQASIGVSSLDLIPDSGMLAFTSGGGRVIALSVGTGERAVDAETEDRSPKLVKFSPSKKHLAALSSDGWFYVWDIARSAQPILQIKMKDSVTLLDGSSPVMNSFDWIDDGKMLFSKSNGELQEVSLDEHRWIEHIHALYGKKPSSDR